MSDLVGCQRHCPACDAVLSPEWMRTYGTVNQQPCPGCGASVDGVTTKMHGDLETRRKQRTEIREKPNRTS